MEKLMSKQELESLDKRVKILTRCQIGENSKRINYLRMCHGTAHFTRNELRNEMLAIGLKINAYIVYALKKYNIICRDSEGYYFREKPIHFSEYAMAYRHSLMLCLKSNRKYRLEKSNKSVNIVE